MKRTDKNQIIGFIKANISHKYVLICVVAVLLVVVLFSGVKHDPTDCDRTSATEMYIRLQNYMGQAVPLGTKDIRRKVVIKTGKKGYINGNKVCYATYKNIMYEEDMKFFDVLSSKWYLDPETGKSFNLFPNEFYPQKTTTVCYMYDKMTHSYKLETGQGCCHSSKPGNRNELIQAYPSKTEEICWL